MELLLSRHGNTFNSGEKVVWVGGSLDLPLVQSGIDQACAFAEALQRSNVMPAAIYCGPLKRTRQYAEIIIDRLALDLTPKIDERLNELDYGNWSGLSSDEVVAKFGEAELKSWEKESRWPNNAHWKGSEMLVVREVNEFVTEVQAKYRNDSTVVVVTSNGRLRYFLKLLNGEFERRIADGSFKVKTGNISKLIVSKGQISFPYWNVDPRQL